MGGLAEVDGVLVKEHNITNNDGVLEREKWNGAYGQCDNRHGKA